MDKFCKRKQYRYCTLQHTESGSDSRHARDIDLYNQSSTLTKMLGGDGDILGGGTRRPAESTPQPPSAAAAAAAAAAGAAAGVKPALASTTGGSILSPVKREGLGSIASGVVSPLKRQRSLAGVPMRPETEVSLKVEKRIRCCTSIYGLKLRVTEAS